MRSARRTLYSIPFLLALTIIAFILAKGAVKIVVKEKESREKVEILSEQLSAQTAREEMLRKNIARLGTPEGLEEEIKNKFNAVTLGEYVALITDDKYLATSTDDSKLPWYKGIWGAIIFWK